MADVGTSVIRVSASDADDPAYGNSAKLVYSMREGQPHFSIDAKTGVIRTALPNMDREVRDSYKLVVEAKDMAGQRGGLTGTTTVSVSLGDINDNPPRFTRNTYQMSVSELAPVGTTVGGVLATDADVGENARFSYSIVGGSDTFNIRTEAGSREGFITLKQPLDYESRRSYFLKVEVQGPGPEGRAAAAVGPFRDATSVTVSVDDGDEAPAFSPAERSLELREDAARGRLLATLVARDPDTAGVPVRYSIDRSTDPEGHFQIDESSGALTLARELDRETRAWHNLSVIATQTDEAALSGRGRVSLRVLDVNDNAPVLQLPAEALVCEGARAGQLVYTLSARDEDESSPPSGFRFSLNPDSSDNFTLRDNLNGTAALFTRRRLSGRAGGAAAGAAGGGLLLPLGVSVSDGGGPPGPRSTTGTLAVRLCACAERDGALHAACSAQQPVVVLAGVGAEALVALLACILILLVLVVLFVALRRRRKEPLAAADEEEIRENIIAYDDEGGGEEDTRAFDMSALRTLQAASSASSANPSSSTAFNNAAAGTAAAGNNNAGAAAGALCCLRQDVPPVVVGPQQKLGPPPPPPAAPSTTTSSSTSHHHHHYHHHQQQQQQQQPQPQPQHGAGDMQGFIAGRVRVADCDPLAPPYDSMQVYAYEGAGSAADSLSSLSSCAGDAEGPPGGGGGSGGGAGGGGPDGEQGYDFLHEWGPRFQRLAEMYGAGDDDVQ
ncbi:LOW QUALITY PROTEIN: cadherin-7-like [Lethenteron reissneri]|uniref:LOW QUALITY PROTEIN: cadherin-7-like n=1 Tax=Lethenteron reissneri TaxID=7753 RepID=UPI002AB6FB45|nr:LOW QUALITY PROTEIN: cadherin-7-like [Lethenteron reissneri]